jgi:hypothetical protein
LAIKAHALLHRHHRDLDDKGQIVADVRDDYRPVAELIGGIVAEASGTSIEKEIQETIDAVTLTTADLSLDQGATADKIAKLLRLDKSSAWRRLNQAAFKGFIVNLESRRGQPGRYRVTNQEIEAEDLLPSIEALEEALQPVQPRNRTCNRQPFERLNDCATGCTVAPIASDGDVEFEERAAILEYDGGLSREEAEDKANLVSGRIYTSPSGQRGRWNGLPLSWWNNAEYLLRGLHVGRPADLLRAAALFTRSTAARHQGKRGLAGH